MKIVNISKLVFGFSWSSTLSWEVTNQKGEVYRMYLGINRVIQNNKSGIQIVLGPMAVIIGVSND